MADFHVGDVGTVLEFPATDQDGRVLDISSFISLYIFIGLPDGVTVLTKTATLTTDGTDGLFRYVTIDGDFPVVGNYKFQGKVVLPSGTWHTPITKKKVLINVRN